LKPKKAVVAGHICLDIIPEIGHELDLRPGALLEVGSAKLSTGGAVSNTGLAMRILGQPVELVGKVGDDAFGEAVARVLESYGEGLGRGLRVGRDASTSYSIVVNIPGRDRIFLHCPGANDQFDADCVEEAVLAGADLLHFGYPPIMARMRENGGASLESLFRRAKAEGAGVSLDMAMPDPAGPSGRVDWRAVLKRTLPFVDVFLPSADELLYALDRERFGKGETLSPSEAARLCDELIEMGAGVAGLKLGARGLYIRTASEERLRRAGRAAPSRPENWAKRELWFPTYKVSRFAGATGAGDATIGAFLCALLRGEAIEDAGRFANAVGACNVEAPDAVGGLLDWSSTWRRLRTGWAINDLAIGEPGWSFDAALGVWRGPADSLVAESV
jgi:sugar/nucleoside kinase (ribokinase family)